MGLCAGRPLIWKMRSTADGVQRVGGQAIDGLGRQRHHLARAQQFRRPPHGGLEQLRRVRRQNFGEASQLLFHRTNLPATAPNAREK